MASSEPQGPVNLTAAADRMSWAEVQDRLRIRTIQGGHALRIDGLADAGAGQPGSGAADTVYVIVSGFGTLRCGSAALDCTAGDVLFVPRGQPHHFEGLDGEIRTWRISLTPDAAEDAPA